MRCDYPNPPGMRTAMQPGRLYSMTDLDKLPVNWNYPMEPLPAPFTGTCRCRGCTNGTSIDENFASPPLGMHFGATILGSR